MATITSRARARPELGDRGVRRQSGLCLGGRLRRSLAGTWWVWAVAFVPLAFVARIIFRAARQAEADGERLKELDQLELARKSHLEHSRR
jgi:hypothetical protein